MYCVTWRSGGKDARCRLPRRPHRRLRVLHLSCLPTTSNAMDSFENFQYDSASSYEGGIVDDTSSVYTVNTTAESQANIPVIDFDSLSITDDRSVAASSTGHEEHLHEDASSRQGLDEDFDAVLDDLKDEGQVDLPPHACRSVTQP